MHNQFVLPCPRLKIGEVVGVDNGFGSHPIVIAQTLVKKVDFVAGFQLVEPEKGQRGGRGVPKIAGRVAEKIDGAVLIRCVAALGVGDADLESLTVRISIVDRYIGDHLGIETDFRNNERKIGVNRAENLEVAFTNDAGEAGLRSQDRDDLGAGAVKVPVCF